MIAKALDVVLSSLNEQLKRTYTLKNSLVTLARLNAPHLETPLIATIVQIAEDQSAHHVAIAKRRTQEVPKMNPQSELQLHLLISVNVQSPYEEGLQYLSTAMSFFNANNALSKINYPKLPNTIQRITIERLDQTMESQSTLWLSLDAAYQPSVVYKLRVLCVDEGVVSDLPSIEHAAKVKGLG